MKQFVAHTTILVRAYDEAINFYVNKLGFRLVKDLAMPDITLSGNEKRWVVVAPPGAMESQLLLARAEGPQQEMCVGNQAGGRVFLFLYTDDFWRDYEKYRASGVEFVRGEPRSEPYGTVAVFKDLYGNLWDLLEPTCGSSDVSKERP